MAATFPIEMMAARRVDKEPPFPLVVRILKGKKFPTTRHHQRSLVSPPSHILEVDQR
jgi:hypothetical protein